MKKNRFKQNGKDITSNTAATKNRFKKNGNDITSKAAVTKNRFKQNSGDMGTSKAVNTAKQFSVNKTDMLGGGGGGNSGGPQKPTRKGPKFTL